MKFPLIARVALALPFLSLGAALLSAADYHPPHKDLGFPVYTNKPAGKQLAGQHVPATTPALSPEEAQKKFTLPEGFEMRLFASEPEVVNPVAMTWDERGRLWVVELYEYPLGAAKGEKGRDRIKILEDTDGDGKADKVTVFADGFSLATAIALGNGGVYLGAAPNLYFLEDTNGDDKADKTTIVKSGFGLDDRHELLNSFTWGPDGWLYMTHGVFTQSKVKNPDDPNDDGVVVNAAVARFNPRNKKFEVFADGTSNPWGVDFDRYGNAFVSACVIDHLFHLAPGGIYVRQGGTPANPYSYQLLPSIVDHRHHMAAYGGVQVYQGNQYPEEYRGTIMMGNIHDNAVHQDRLTPNGSSFKASFIKDFIRANDGWFMPVSEQVGPDGCLWVMDWYDRYPCYQNARADPEGVDREHGRIWRVVYTGKDKGKPVPSRPDKNMNLAKLKTVDLVKLLAYPNSWQRRMAQRLLSERHDSRAAQPLKDLLSSGKSLEARLAALWTLHSSGQLDGHTLDSFDRDPEAAVRTWVARLTGEGHYKSDVPVFVGDVKLPKIVGQAILPAGEVDDTISFRLGILASDPDASVRLAVATALRQLASGSLTVDTPSTLVGKPDEKGVFEILVKYSADAKDPLIPFMIWQAWEPKVAADPKAMFDWLQKEGPQTMPLSGQLAYKTMRRVCDLQKPAALDAATDFLAAMPVNEPLLAYALNGLVDGQKGKAVAPTKPTEALFTRLLASTQTDTVKWAQQLGSLWGNARAMESTLAAINNTSAPLDDRIKAVQTARQLKNDAARDALLRALSDTKNTDAFAVEVVRALGETGGDLAAERLLAGWKGFSPAVRRTAAEVLASRDRWASGLLSAIEKKDIVASEIPAITIRTLTRSQADYGMLAKRAALVFGKVRDADADKLKIMATKKKMILDGTKPDLKAGHEVAQRTCFVCHKLYGEGAEVGPDLTGVGRSSLDALLANVIDPNQIIGAGYEMVEVTTKDERTVSGRIVENSDARVRLLSAGPREDVVAKSDIASIRVSQLSVMPEGLEQMPDADFRNLIAYILNPPGDKQPFSWKNEESAPKPVAAPKQAAANVDWESVSLWNPDWKVAAAEFDGTPVKLVEFEGRKNVLLTHPFSREKASALERTIEVPAKGKTTLAFAVAAHEKGDWELRVTADGKEIHKQTVDHAGDRWKPVSVDLTPFAGKKIAVRLENAANGWSWEFGYWHGIELRHADGQTASSQ